jgi:hypothetical protein
MSSVISASTTSSTALTLSGDTSGQLEIKTGSTPSTAVTITSGQGVQVLNTIGVGNATPSTSGAGISFPATQSASSDANTLDDYEEGTWTPAGNGITYSTADGSYTKIGRVVTARFTIVFPSTGSGGIARLSGLPFTSTSSGTNPTFGGFLSYSTHGSGILVQILDNTTVIQFDDLSSNAIQNATLSTKSFRGVVVYFV